MSSIETPPPDPMPEAVDGAGGAPLGVTPLGIWSLAWPTMAAMATGTIVRFTDFAMVGSLGPSALAAVGIGGQFYWLIESLAAIAPAGVTAILSRAVGAGDASLADAALKQANWLGAALGLAGCLLLFPFTTEAIAIYGVEDEVVELGSGYLWWRLWGTLPLSILMVFAAALRAAGDVKTALWASIVSSVANVFLNWVLIHGHLGAPRLGVVGAAIASNVALTIFAVVFVVLWWRRVLVLVPGNASWRPDPSLARRLVRVGTPAGIESGFFQVGLLLFQRIMAPFGTNVIAAYNVGSMLLSFSFIPGVAFSLTAATLVGQNLGAGTKDTAAREGWRSTVGAVGTMTVVGALLALFARPIALVFTDDPEVVELTRIALVMFALAHPFMAVEFAIGGALRGAGDTFFPMLTVFIGLIVVRLGVAAAIVYFLDAPIEWVWAVLILDYALKSVLLIVRFRRGSWRDRRV